MNIFRRELKANLKSLIIWCVVMGLFDLGRRIQIFRLLQ